MAFPQVKLALIFATIIGLFVAQKSWENEYSNNLAQEAELVQNNSSNLEELKTEEFKVVGEFSEGLARIERDKKYGFVDELGNIAIAPIYDEAGDFSEGLVAVVIDRQSSFIDGAGKVVISLTEYDVYTNYVESQVTFGGELPYWEYLYSLSQFKNGIAEVSKPELPRDYQPKTIESANQSKKFICTNIDKAGVISEERLCEIEMR